MKTYEVHSLATGERWKVRQPSVNDCNAATEYIAARYRHDWLDLVAIRIDGGEPLPERTQP